MYASLVRLTLSDTVSSSFHLVSFHTNRLNHQWRRFFRWLSLGSCLNAARRATYLLHILYIFYFVSSFFRYFVFFSSLHFAAVPIASVLRAQKRKKNFDSQTGNIWCTQFILPDHVHNFIIDFVQLAHVRSKFFLFHSLFASLLFIVKINDEEYVFRLRKERSNWRKYVKYVWTSNVFRFYYEFVVVSFIWTMDYK